MQFKNALALSLFIFTFMSGSAAVAAPQSQPASSQSASHAAKPQPAVHKVVHHSRRAGGTKYHYKTYFVPPPPAVMPSILPELTARQMQGEDTTVTEDGEKPPENPYKKYIHTPDGDAPAPIQTRKGVVIWSQKS